MTQDDQQESFEFSEDGEFIDLNGKLYLRYLEHQGGVTTPVRFRLDDGEVALHRQGATETWLNFDMTAPTITRYQTEYGMMQFQVVTTELESSLDSTVPAGELKVSYQLKAGEQIIGTYQLELQFAA